MTYSNPKRCGSDKEASKERSKSRHSLFLLSIRPELLEIGPKVADFCLVLGSREKHLRVGDLGARVLDVFLECLLAPGNAGALHSCAIIEAVRCAGLATVDAVERWAELDFSVFTNVMADLAFALE